jgi:hypothetical protein
MENLPELIQAVLSLRRCDLRYDVIAQAVNEQFNLGGNRAKTPEAIRHIWRKHGDRVAASVPFKMERRYGRNVPIDIKDPRVLIIPDLHMPFMVPNFIDFLCRVRDKYKLTRVFGIGDAFDHHAVSFWDNAPGADDALNEYHKAVGQAGALVSEFPNILWTVGNHDDRHLKLGARAGIPDIYMRDINDIFEMPDTWIWHKSYILNGTVLIEHGSSSGRNATFDRALVTSKNVIQGHTHSYGGVQYINDGFNVRWALNVGCGMDNDSYAALYAEHHKFKPTLGCGILIEDIPHFIPYNG